MVCKDCNKEKPLKNYQDIKNTYKGVTKVTKRGICNSCMNKKWTYKWIENNKERVRKLQKKYELELRDFIITAKIKASKKYKDKKFNITKKCIEMKRKSVQSKRDYDKFVNRYLS